MASQDAPRDDNFIPAALFEIDGSPGEVMPGQIDEATGRVLVLGTGVGSGSVTSVSVVSANGFAGTVATASTTPAITLTTTITGILKGNGTAVSAVTIGSGLAYDGTTLSSTATGDVTKVGTPVNNQVGVWTGDGTLEGDAALTFDTTTDTLTAGILNSTSLTASEIVITDASKNLVSAAVATYPSLTELTYLKGVTSAIQTQLNAKGTGNVTKVGTPANNQIGVWTGDGTIEGDASLTYDGTNLNLATAKNFQIAGATVLADAAGTTTLSNIDAVDATTEATIEAAIDALTSVVLTTPTITTSVVPTTNEGAALGSATNQFSDLFLAEGGVINWDNGDATLTQVGNVLTLAGADLKISTPGTASTSVATIDGTQTLTNKTISGALTLAEGGSVALDPAGSADGAYSGITMTATAGYTQAFGDLVYLASADSRWEAADADAATTGDRMLAMVVVAGTDGNACTLLLQGTIRADAKFPALTVGSAVYVGEAAGEIQVAIPTGADNVIRRVGYALTADSIYFNPSMDSQISVA